MEVLESKRYTPKAAERREVAYIIAYMQLLKYWDFRKVMLQKFNIFCTIYLNGL